MDQEHSDKVTAFDALFTTNHIQMLKILLVFLDPIMQKKVAVYIKFLELQYTLLLFRQNPDAAFFIPETSNKITDVFNELFLFCSPAEKEKMQNFRNLYQNLENMQEMLQTIQIMQEISPELFSQGMDGSGTNPFSGFEEMDPNQMMELLQALFAGS